jgi:hypothetical protein
MTIGFPEDSEFSRKFAAMSAEFAKALQRSPRFQEAMRELSRSATLSGQAQSAMQQIANSPALRRAALDAAGFNKAMSPALEKYAQSLRLFQSADSSQLQEMARKIMEQSAVSNFHIDDVRSATNALQEVDIQVGANVMEESLRDEDVEGVVAALTETAREHGLPEVLAEEEAPGEDRDSSVQRTAVWLFVYLCGSGVLTAAIVVPALANPVGIGSTSRPAAGPRRGGRVPTVRAEHNGVVTAAAGTPPGPRSRTARAPPRRQSGRPCRPR